MNKVKLTNAIFSQIKSTRFAVKLWNGEKRLYGSGNGVKFTLVFNTPDAFDRILSQGSLGFGESYMDGSLEIHGSVEEYLKLRHAFRKVKPSMSLAIAKFIALSKTPKRKHDQISYHYDLGNNFFSLILDTDTMSYSSGFFDGKKGDLSDAQVKKLTLLSQWLDLPKGSHVLDLGSGWGGFAKHAIQKYSYNITGLTLSKKQIIYCKENLRLKNGNASFLYRDMMNPPKRKFDGAVCIEAIEHVGEKNLGDFIKGVNQSIKLGAPFVLQFTGRYKEKNVDRWTLKYVFPGGYLPSIQEVERSALGNGFVVERMRDDTDDYIRTMNHWIGNLTANRDAITKMFDESFYRLWFLWMSGAKVNFEIKDMSLFRLRLRKVSEIVE